MKRSTFESYFKEMKEGLKLYYVNPLECGKKAQTSVRMHEWTIVKVKRKELWGLIGEDIIFYTEKGSSTLRTTSIKNIFSHPLKKISIVRKVAEDYLDDIHLGEYACEVDAFHKAVELKYK